MSPRDSIRKTLPLHSLARLLETGGRCSSLTLSLARVHCISAVNLLLMCEMNLRTFQPASRVQLRVFARSPGPFAFSPPTHLAGSG